MTMAAGHLALLCLFLSLFAAEARRSRRTCSAFSWPSDLGSNPMQANRGKVVLIALMKGYCQYCVHQAAGLESLKTSLALEGYHDIAMIIVNGGEQTSRDTISNLQQASSLPVLQDTVNHVMFQTVFQGNKDDFIVYNRCGNRVAFIPNPYSYLGHTLTGRVLKAVHNGRHTCPCSLDQSGDNAHNVMYGDQPAGQSVVQRSQGLDCPQEDTICRQYTQTYMPNTGSNRHSNRSRQRTQQNNHGHGRGHRGNRGHNRQRHRGRTDRTM